jgi:hypothetical protein
MFVFDVETLGKDSSSVILSMACLYFNPEEKKSYQELIDSAFFVKLDAEDQMLRLKRTSKRGTIEWWSKQCDNARNKSFRPSVIDVTAEEAVESLRTWSTQFLNHDTCVVWARGNLDQLVLDSLEEQLEVKPVFYFSRWRDVRTAIDFIIGSPSGYAKVDYPGFDPALHVTKHNPVDDCAYDAMQLMYGVKE